MKKLKFKKLSKKEKKQLAIGTGIGIGGIIGLILLNKRTGYSPITSFKSVFNKIGFKLQGFKPNLWKPTTRRMIPRSDVVDYSRSDRELKNLPSVYSDGFSVY